MSHPPFILNSDEAHIWSLSFPQSNVSLFYNLLSPKEKEHSAHFNFSRDYDLFVTCRGVLRYLLGQYLNILPEKIPLTQGEFGKPYLENSTLQFNLSHSQERALYVITERDEVGIDVEYKDKNFNLEKSAPYFFLPEELAFWEQLDPITQRDYFFNIWVCREAFFKSLGTGWLEKEHNITFKPKENFRKKYTNEIFLKNKIGSLYFLQEEDDYVSALFVKKKSKKIKYHNFFNVNFLKNTNYYWPLEQENEDEKCM